MGLVLQLEKLASRVTRQNVSLDGIRTFTANALKASEKEGDHSWWDSALKFGGSLLKKTWDILTSGISFSLTALYSAFIAGVNYLWNFNWNQSDEDLDKQTQSAINEIAGAAGSFVGDILGWGCGLTAGAVIATFDEAMANYVFKQLGEQALQDIAGHLANLVQVSATALTHSFFASSYKNIRNLFRESDADFKKHLVASGAKPENIQKALDQRHKPWSFAKAYEETIQSIPNETLRTFIQSAGQEFASACIHSGYVVVGSVESYMAQQKMAHTATWGEETVVEISLDRSAVQVVNDG